LLDVGLGDLGLAPKAFWALTLAEFDAMRRGHQRRTVREWQHTRWLGWLLVSINSDPDGARPTLSDIMPLPGDDDYALLTAAPIVKTAAERAAQEARIKERYEKNLAHSVAPA
jgi:hypothetical protein